MKKMVVRPQGEGRYLVLGGPVKKSVLARDKRDALRRAKAVLTSAERQAYRAAPTRRERETDR